MEPHIDVITLAVGDLDRSLAFYRDGLGLETSGVVAAELVDEETGAAGAIVQFHLRGGLILALYPRSEPKAMTTTEMRERACGAPGGAASGNPELGGLTLHQGGLPAWLHSKLLPGARRLTRSPAGLRALRQRRAGARGRRAIL
jgi:catechol 2,3-dioxygenase-like lactoylglutathione lyase family enzyme